MRQNMTKAGMLAGTLALFAAGAFAHPQITQVPPPDTDPTSGVQMYRTYCAVCHGLTGKGDGPAVPALKEKPPDLTLISKSNGGEFPSFRVSTIIQSDAVFPAHGSGTCPCGETHSATFNATRRL